MMGRGAARLGALMVAWTVAGSVGAAPVRETDRLYVVGTRAFEDELYDVADRELGRFVQVARDDPRLGDALLLRGKALFALRRYEEAQALFQAAETLPLRVTSPSEVLFWQGETAFRLKRFEDARQRYDLYLRASPAAPYTGDALYARAFADLELGRTEDALQSLDRLLREHPQSPFGATAAYTAARELVRARRWDQALPILSTYASRYPTSPYLAESRYLLGVTQLESGRADGARTLEQFLVTDPGHDLAANARLLLAEAYVKAGRLREAVTHYQAIVRKDPSAEVAAPALYQIGDLSERLGRGPEAEAAWTALRRDYPRHALAGPAGLALAQGHVKRKRFEAAYEAAREVAEAGGAERLDALMIVGDSALQLRRNQEAEVAYAALVAEAPADAGPRFRALAGLALAAEAQGEKDTARRAYREIASDAPDPELKRWATSRVEALDAPPPPPPRTPKATPPAPRKPSKPAVAPREAPAKSGKSS